MFANLVKFSAVTLASVVTVSAFATSTRPNLPSGATSYQNSDLISVSVESLCPANVLCALNGTRVTLEFSTPCAGGLVEPIQVYNAESKLFVGATSYATKATETAKCFWRSSKFVTLSFPMQFFSESDVVSLEK